MKCPKKANSEIGAHQRLAGGGGRTVCKEAQGADKTVQRDTRDFSEVMEMF